MTSPPKVQLSPYERAVNHLNQLPLALNRIFAAALDDLRRQRDEQAARCRAAAQALIEDVGADRPMSLEQVVERTIARISTLEALVTDQDARERIRALEAQVAQQEKRLARYRETIDALGSELRHIDHEEGAGASAAQDQGVGAGAGAGE